MQSFFLLNICLCQQLDFFKEYKQFIDGLHPGLIRKYIH